MAFLSFHSKVVCRASNSAVTREVPLEKKVDVKYMQINVLRNIASMKKRGRDMRTDQIERQCHDAFGM